MDTLAMICLILGQLILVTKGVRISMWFFLVGSLLWLWVGVDTDSVPLAVQSAAFCLINLWGILRAR